MPLPPHLLHGLVPAEGRFDLAAEILAYVGILLAAFGLVALTEDQTRTGRTQLAWGALILFLPLIGPSTYLIQRARTSPSA